MTDAPSMNNQPSTPTATMIEDENEYFYDASENLSVTAEETPHQNGSRTMKAHCTRFRSKNLKTRGDCIITIEIQIVEK